VLWGTLFPILSEAVRGTKITVGPPFYNRVNLPLGLLLLGLTGIGPLIAWRKASSANLRRQFVGPVACGLVVLAGLAAAGVRDLAPLMTWSLAGFVLGTILQEFTRGTRARMRMYGEGVFAGLGNLVARNRRRYGGYLVHLGMLTYFVAFAGMAFKVEREATLKPGESIELRSAFGDTYRFTHVGISQFKELNRYTSAATVEVARNGKPDGRIVSEKRQHFTMSAVGTEEASFEPSTEVGIRSGLREDIYVVFAGAVNGTEEAVYRFNLNTLVWWVWAGGFILVVGGLVTMWPGGGAPAGRSRVTEPGYGVAMGEAVR
jgi:cytochrome c-type biogenesis protein CcmF